MQYIGAIPNLTTLTIPVTKVTDHGVRHLHSLSKLRSIILPSTLDLVTVEAEQELRRVLPNCDVRR